MNWLPTLTPRRRRQLWYVPTLALAMGVTMLRLLVMARLLSVSAFASYSAGLLMSSTFCMVSCLGLQSLLQREWPVFVLHGQHRHAAVRVAQCCLLLVAAAALLMPLAWFSDASAVMTPLLVMVGVLHGVAQQTFLVASMGSRSAGDALGYSRRQLVRSALAFIGAVAVAAWLGRPLFVLLFEAILAVALSSGMLRSVLKHARLGCEATLRLAIRRARRIPWRASLLSMAVMLTAFAIMNVDRWVAAHELATPAFAQYSFVAILLALAQAAQGLINASVYPLLARRRAEQGQAAVFRICIRLTVALAVVGMMLTVPTVTAVRFAVATWYPDYQPVLTLVPIVTLVGLLRICDFSSSYLMVIGREERMLAMNVLTLVGGGGSWLLWVRAGSDAAVTLPQLVGLAAALSVVSTVATTITAWGLNTRQCGKERQLDSPR